MNKKSTLLLSLLVSQAIWAQVTITGVVKSADDIPLKGVKVSSAGDELGAVFTDSKGQYSIVVSNEDAQLVFSTKGYSQETLGVPENHQLNVSLSKDYYTIDEVVIVGYGKTKRSDLTGAVASISPSKVLDAPSNSIERALQGRVAGLQITNSSQDPGAGATVRIRGGSSLRGSNAPLVVVDGFPLGDAGDLKQINPTDIESIDVLKDASASAIYGSRGANGVIIITTKSGKRGKMKIELSQQTTFSSFSSKLDLWRDPLLMAELNNESRINGGLTPLYIGATNATGVYYPSLSEIQSGAWPYFTKWDKEILRSAPVLNNSTVTVSSGNETTNFSLSFNNYEQDGVYINDDYSKKGYNLRFRHKLNDKVQVRISNIISKGKSNYNRDLALWRNPIFPIYQENGDYFLIGNQDFNHPIAITENRINKSSTTDVIANGEISWDIIKGLKLTSRLNYKLGESVNDQYFPTKYTESGTFNNGAAWINNWKGENIVSETFTNYDFSFGKHKFDTTLGYSYESYISRSSSLGAFDFVNESLGNENMGAGNPQMNQISNGYSKSELVSGIFRVNYTYNKKYLATFTARADGSSKFGSNNKWALFPSGALSWKINEEDFLKDVESISQLKLRTSFGISGNQGISAYQTLSRYGISKYYDNGTWVTAIGPGYQVGTAGQGGIEALWGGIPNPNLKWETTSQFNIGVDYSMFQDRLSMTLDYYSKETKDLLRERILAPSSGYDRMWINDGSISNKGFEATINGTIVDKDDFKVNTTLIYAINKNKVLSLGDAVQSGLSTDPNTGMQYEYWGNSIEMFRMYPNILAIGKPINAFYGYKVNGIIQTLQEGIEAGLDGEMAKPGEFKYVDINGDGIIDARDQTIIGDPNPDFTLSFNLGINYKNWDLNAFVFGSFGQDVLNTQAFNQPSNTPLRWTQDNPTQDYPSLREGRTLYMSDWWIQDGSFLRIQNVSLGYTFNNLEKFVNKARLYVNANNLYTFTKFKGYDPEVSSNGIYYGGYPRLRQVTLGLDLTF